MRIRKVIGRVLVAAAVSGGLAMSLAPTALASSGLTVNATSLTPEGDVGTGLMAFTVSLTEASAEPVSVDYSTVDGSASAGSDYVAASGTVLFSPGSVSQVVTVTLLGDTVVEGDETFTIVLGSPVGASILAGTGVGIIMDDEWATPPEPGSPSAGETPPDWLQSYGRSLPTAACLDGWSPSYAEWPNGGRGGWVCDRTLSYREGRWG